MKTPVVGMLACFFVAPAPALADQRQTTSRADGVVRVATLDELRRELSPGDFINDWSEAWNSAHFQLVWL